MQNGTNKYGSSITSWQYLIFIFFYILCLRIVITTCYQPDLNQIIQLSIFFLISVGLTLLNISWSLYFFIISLPLISGLQAIGIIKISHSLSFNFSCIYLTWFSKGILLNKFDFKTKSTVGIFINLLITVIALSLLNLLLTYPIGNTLHTLIYIPVINSQDELHGITASFIILQGLFFYRLIEIESSTLKLQKNIYWIFCIHALSIFFFSLIQLVWKTPSTLNIIALYSPFEDIHSFGSYITFLFFIFLNHSYSAINSFKIFSNSLTILFFVLIVLSYSKATWAATIIIICALFYNKLSLRKCIIFIALGVSIILFLNIFPSFLQNSKNPYFTRFNQLLQVTQYFDSSMGSNLSRVALYKRALNMIMQCPITGRGIGTFYKLSPYYSGKDDSFSTFQENTHNYFLQIAAEIGIPALLILLSIIYYTFKIGIKAVRKDIQESIFLKGLLFGLSAYLLTCITGHPLLLSNQQFLFWFIIASITLGPPFLISQKYILTYKYQRLILLFLIIIVISHAYNLTKINDLPKKIYGTYAWENINDQKICWTKKESSSVVSANTNLVGLKVVANKINVDDNGLFFRAFINNSPIIEQHFSRPGEILFYCYLSDINSKDITLKTFVDKTFCPKTMGISQDNRQLGLMISPVSFLVDILPKDGIGFYNYEKPSVPLSPDWPQEQSFESRWTSIRASMDVENYTSNGLTLFLHASHPDLTKIPVTAQIIGENGLIKEVLFNSHDWQKITITPEMLRGSTILTFQVSRTWNPKLMGISGDTRDLGVAVAIVDKREIKDVKIINSNIFDPLNQSPEKTVVIKNLIPDILLLMDFSKLISKGESIYAKSSITGQKVMIEDNTKLVEGPYKGTQAIMIDGDNNYTRVNCSPLDINTTEGTFSIWARLINPQKENSCLIAVHAQNRRRIICIDHEGSDGKFNLYYNSIPIGRSSIAIKDDAWHQYVFTWKDRGQRFFIDGQEVLDSESAASTLAATVFGIGWRGVWYNNQWHGYIANLLTLKHALTKDEIETLYGNNSDRN